MCDKCFKTNSDKKINVWMIRTITSERWQDNQNDRKWGMTENMTIRILRWHRCVLPLWRTSVKSTQLGQTSYARVWARKVGCTVWVDKPRVQKSHNECEKPHFWTVVKRRDESTARNGDMRIVHRGRLPEWLIGWLKAKKTMTRPHMLGIISNFSKLHT